MKQNITASFNNINKSLYIYDINKLYLITDTNKLPTGEYKLDLSYNNGSYNTLKKYKTDNSLFDLSDVLQVFIDISN